MNKQAEKIGKYMTAEASPGGIWCICNKRSDDMIAYLEYYRPWKQWIFSSYEGAVFSADCLRDIATLLERLNLEGNGKLDHRITPQT